MSLSSSELQQRINDRVADAVDTASLRGKADQNVRPCTECREGFEREINERLIESTQPYVNVGSTGGTGLLASTTIAKEEENKARSSTALILVVVVLGILAAYFLFFNQSSDGTGDDDQIEQTARKPIPEPTRRSNGPANVFNFSIDNFTKVMSDELKTEFEQTDLAALKTTLSGKGAPAAEFAGASLPLKGATVLEQKGTSVPGIVYTDGKARLFVTEIPIANVESKKSFYVADDVLQQVKNGERVWIDAPSNGKVVVFRKGESVIAAVANRTQSEMEKLLGLN